MFEGKQRVLIKRKSSERLFSMARTAILELCEGKKISEIPKRLRRRQLPVPVPGSNEKMTAKALKVELDHVFLDLEALVASSAKSLARGLMVEFRKTI